MGQLKSKLISIVLGALGSMITVAISYFAAPEAAAGAAVVGGAATSGLLTSVVERAFG